MSDTNALSVLPSAARHAQDITQITAIEQARAIAEVQARVIVAQNNPRVVQDAIAEMEMVCQQKLLADRAFFNVPRGGSIITDVSIHLAKELARCWRNVDYEVAELRRDDEKGHSEMLAWAWDMQANNKASIKFQVPHTRDMKTGSRRMNDINDIYNLLANMGSRRVREQILKILPTWFVERAKELCYKTIENGGGVPLPQRIAAAIKAFDEQGITTDRIEHRFGVKPDKWTPHHLAQLQVIHTSLHQGTTTVEDEFPVAPITRDNMPDMPPAQPADRVEQDAAAFARLATHVPGLPDVELTVTKQEYWTAPTPETLTALQLLMAAVGHVDLAAALDDIRILTRRPKLGSYGELSATEVDALISKMTDVCADEHPGHAMDALLDAIREGHV